MTVPVVPQRNHRRTPGSGCLNWIIIFFALLVGLLVLRIGRPRPHLGGMDHAHLHKAILIDQEVEYSKIFYELVYEDKDKQIQRYVAKEKWFDGPSQNITVHRWLTLLNHHDQEYGNQLISKFINVLQASNMNAFFFETKGVNYHTSYTEAFEFVLIGSQQLYDFADAQQDVAAFGDLLKCGEREVVNEDDEGNAFGCVFKNLGGDSTLIAPKFLVGYFPEPTPQNVYGHLGAFIHRAPAVQVVYFFRLALETYLGKLEEDKTKTIWFSTDGRGVKWLHLRLDPTPKYYDYKPFAKEI